MYQYMCILCVNLASSVTSRTLVQFQPITANTTHLTTIKFSASSQHVMLHRLAIRKNLETLVELTLQSLFRKEANLPVSDAPSFTKISTLFKCYNLGWCGIIKRGSITHIN